MSVRPYVRPQKVCPISMKFGMYIEVDEYCMSHDPIQGQGHGACEIPIIALFKLYLLRHLHRELANDH